MLDFSDEASSAQATFPSKGKAFGYFFPLIKSSNMGLIDRKNLTWTHPEVVDGFLRGLKAGRKSQTK